MHPASPAMGEQAPLIDWFSPAPFCLAAPAARSAFPAPFSPPPLGMSWLVTSEVASPQAATLAFWSCLGSWLRLLLRAMDGCAGCPAAAC